MPGQLPISDDLKELIKLFLSHGVEFVVVGAHALAFHARPRFTEDLDLFVRRSKENAARIRSALEELEIRMSDEAVLQLSEDDRAMIVLGRKPNQVDLLNFLDGVSFEDVWRNRVSGFLGDVEVSYLSLSDYVKTKRASGRSRDIDDLNRLQEFLGGNLPED